MSVTQIHNLKEFENFMKSEKGYFVIDFYADWCGPCKIMAPIFQEISEDSVFEGKVRFLKINRDENRDLVAKYGFNIPTIPRFFLIESNETEFSNANILLELGGSQGHDTMIDQITNKLNLSKIQHMSENSHNNAKKSHKVAIIGSGPSGLTAAIYTSRAELDTTVYTGIQPGGQLTTTTEIENFPGAWSKETKQGMMGPDLMELVQKQAEHFGAKVVFDEVRGIEVDKTQKEGQFKLILGGKEENFDAVIIASGASAKYLGISGEEKFVGKGYHSCATCDGFFYRGRTIAVAGGGDSAMEEANFLTKFADKVYLIHRREEFRASKIMLERAKNNPKIEFILNKKIVDFVGTEEVKGVKLEDTKTGEKSEMALDAVFVAIGHTPNTGFVKGKLDMNDVGYLVPQSPRPPEDRTSKYLTMSSVDGIFVAGDVEDQIYRQAITAAGQGCKAAIDAEKWLEDRGE